MDKQMTSRDEARAKAHDKALEEYCHRARRYASEGELVAAAVNGYRASMEASGFPEPDEPIPSDALAGGDGDAPDISKALLEGVIDTFWSNDEYLHHCRLCDADPTDTIESFRHLADCPAKMAIERIAQLEKELEVDYASIEFSNEARAGDDTYTSI